MPATTAKKTPKTAAPSLENLIKETRAYPQHELEATIESYEHSAENYREEAEAQERYAQNAREELARLQERQTGFDAEAQAAKIMAQLKRHRDFDSIKVMNDGNDGVAITTRLLFTRIRDAEGSKKTERACIGAYQIEAYVGGGLRIHSLLFARHWSINSSSSPCLGEWDSEVKKFLRAGEYARLFDTLMHYLKSTEDGSAYEPSHYWRDRRALCSLPTTAVPAAHSLAVGDYVIGIIPQFEGLNMLGLVGQVIVIDESRPQLIKILWRTNHHVEWYVPRDGVQKISKQKHDKQERYDIALPYTRALRALDKLDGGTVSDAQKIVTEVMSKPVRI